MTSQAHDGTNRQELLDIPNDILVIKTATPGTGSGSTTLRYDGYNLEGHTGGPGMVTKACFQPVGQNTVYTSHASTSGSTAATCTIPKAMQGQGFTWLEDDDGNRSNTLQGTYTG